jgi:cytochrome c-type biogenesis protein CcmH/NrfF
MHCPVCDNEEVIEYETPTAIEIEDLIKETTDAHEWCDGDCPDCNKRNERLAQADLAYDIAKENKLDPPEII